MEQSNVPAHGRGRILVAGKIGNKGGGRPPCAIKAACRESFEKGVQSATNLVLGLKVNGSSDQPTNADIMRAFNMLGKYGFSVTETIVPESLIPLVSKVLSDHLPPEAHLSAINQLIELMEACPE